MATKNWAVVYDVRFYVVAGTEEEAKAKGERLFGLWSNGHVDADTIDLGECYCVDDDGTDEAAAENEGEPRSANSGTPHTPDTKGTKAQ